VTEAFLQFVECGPLHRRGLNRLADAVDRQVGDARRLLIAKLREIALIFSSGSSAGAMALKRAFCSSLSDW
jgi:hypothetical protein